VHRKIGRVEQRPREVGAPRARDAGGRGADVLREEPAQLPGAHAEAAGERLDVAGVERARVDQAKGTRDEGGRAEPRRRPGRGLGTASPARPEARRLRGRRAREEATVLALGGPDGADGPTIDPGRGDAGEEPAVETRILDTKAR
jgi:hypothetical protein